MEELKRINDSINMINITWEAQNFTNISKNKKETKLINHKGRTERNEKIKGEIKEILCRKEKQTKLILKSCPSKNWKKIANFAVRESKYELAPRNMRTYLNQTLDNDFPKKNKELKNISEPKNKKGFENFDEIERIISKICEQMLYCGNGKCKFC